MPRPKKKPSRSRRNTPPAAGLGDDADSAVRIIGGSMRGRRLSTLSRPGTRPMKHRVREAVFDLLGPSVEGCWAIDLFAGTGALGLEAISRGAVGATLVERHIPTAKLIQKSAADLGVAERAEVIMASAMVWAQRGKFPAGKWLVFCSPPYDFYVERSQDMLDLIRTMVDSAPAASTLVVEADERLDESTLPRAADWRVRRYPPAVIALLNVEN